MSLPVFNDLPEVVNEEQYLRFGGGHSTMERPMAKLKSKMEHMAGRLSSRGPPSSPIASKQHLAMRPPTALDILRYRYQYGVNLGGVFVLEKWIWPSMFGPSAEGDSELDAVVA